MRLPIAILVILACLLALPVTLLAEQPATPATEQAATPAAQQPAAEAEDPQGTTPAEEELGKKTAEQIEKEYKLVKDDAAMKRLETITAAIAPVTQRPGVVYHCKILDTGALNAMVIPGGTIYVTKGLLDAVESDDELAGVLAHEIAHNSLFHARKMMEREARMSLMQVLTVIGTVYMNRNDSVPTGQILTMSELVKQALLNGYGVDLEIEADRYAIDYLYKLRVKEGERAGKMLYDPVGLYSVILGFQHMESGRVQVEMGYLKTHPYSAERRELLEKHLKALGIKINLWNVVHFRAELLPPTDAVKGYGVKLGSVELIRLTAADGDKDAQARADAAAKAINRRLTSDYLREFDVSKDEYDGKAYIQLRTIPVLALTQADADAAGVTLEALSNLTVMNIRSAIWQEAMKRG